MQPAVSDSHCATPACDSHESGECQQEAQPNITEHMLLLPLDAEELHNPAGKAAAASSKDGNQPVLAPPVLAEQQPTAPRSSGSGANSSSNNSSSAAASAYANKHDRTVGFFRRMSFVMDCALGAPMPVHLQTAMISKALAITNAAAACYTHA